MLILIFICRLLCKVTNRVWKWRGVANHVPVVRIIAVSPPYTLHKQHDEVRKSALHHGEEPGTRQQSTSTMYIGQSWNRVDATKNSHLLQFVARNRKIMAGKVHKQITQNATPGCPCSLLYIGFFVFLFFAASLEVLVCSMDKRWQEQQIVILHNALEWTYLYEKFSRDLFLFSLQTLGPNAFLCL